VATWVEAGDSVASSKTDKMKNGVAVGARAGELRYRPVFNLRRHRPQMPATFLREKLWLLADAQLFTLNCFPNDKH